MDIMAYLDAQKQQIDTLIRRYLPQTMDAKEVEWLAGKPRFAHDREAIANSLLVPSWDLLNRGGKRWRPALFLLLVEALGGDVNKVRDVAILPELVHNGTLIIDDIEDGGEVRRGKPCLHKIYGIDIAINAGNFLYFHPLLTFAKQAGRFDDTTLRRAYEAYAQEMINVSIGQGTDIYWHKGKKSRISEEQYLQMCAFKTGCLSRLAGRLAAIFAGADKAAEDKVGRFCESVGIAFQIQDDILSATATGEFAKRKGYGDDITEGKRSLLVIHALGKADPEDRLRLLDILNRHTREEKAIAEALAILKKYQSAEYAKRIARTLVEDAWEALEPELDASHAKELLASLVRFATERQI
ncbi:MAG: polyprenyl synthetase family protein [Candidatus Aenigmarchaeota archaeon]|nr:polyprenyl synthetase family protein [Candidatus Aenigmarchaeota archaeon]